MTELFDFDDNDSSIAETMTEIASIMRGHSMTFQHFKENMFRRVSVKAKMYCIILWVINEQGVLLPYDCHQENFAAVFVLEVKRSGYFYNQAI